MQHAFFLLSLVPAEETALEPVVVLPAEETILVHDTQLFEEHTVK